MTDARVTRETIERAAEELDKNPIEVPKPKK